MAEQVVDLLEAVEVEAQHGEAASARRRRRDVLIEPRVEAAAVRKAGQRVVMRQEVDVPLGFRARLQVADRDGIVRPPA